MRNKQTHFLGALTLCNYFKEAYIMTENNINENNSAELENEGQQENETKTYTEEEVRELLQRETDRRVSSALKKQEKDYQKKMSLAQLDERERANAEKDMRIAELQEKLAAFEIEKNRSELKSILASRGLSAQFADLIQITDDMDESQQRIDTLDKLFKAAVADEVKKRLATSSPVVGTGDSNAMTKEKFHSLSLSERNRLYTTNPELYNKLIT